MRMSCAKRGDVRHTNANSKLVISLLIIFCFSYQVVNVQNAFQQLISGITPAVHRILFASVPVQPSVRR